MSTEDINRSVDELGTEVGDHEPATLNRGEGSSTAPEPMEDPRSACGYGVGYGKPPLHSRFPPGKSGNPKGRPRRVKQERSVTYRQYRRDVLAVTEELVTVRTASGDRRVPYHIANLLAIREKAIRGHGPSQRFIEKLHRDAVLSHEEAHSAFSYLEEIEQRITYGPIDSRDPERVQGYRRQTRCI